VFNLTRRVAAVATAVLAVTLPAAAPASAYTPITQDVPTDRMRAAVTDAMTATRKAAEAGWRQRASYTSMLGTTSWAINTDVPGGRSITSTTAGTTTFNDMTVAGSGWYGQIVSKDGLDAMKMIGKPAVKYYFIADRNTVLTSVTDRAEADLGDLAGSTGTRTINPDGSVTYRAVTALESTVALTVAATGEISEVVSRLEYGGGVENATTVIRFEYGTQTVVLPAKSQTIGRQPYQAALGYHNLPGDAAVTARSAAAAARTISGARAAMVAAARKDARRTAAALNSYTGVNPIKVSNIDNGVRIHGTNPYTKKVTSVTVTVSKARKVVVSGR
jgi:hypothetical protein